MPRVSRLSHYLFCSAILVAVTVLSVGCGSSSSTGASATEIRFVNASPNQATVNVLIDGVSVATALANGGGATAYLPVASGARRIQIQDPATSQNIIDTTPNISGNTTYIVTNFIGSITPLILSDDNTAPTTGDFKLRAINLAPSLNAGVDAYVELSTITTLSGLTPSFSALPFPPTTASTYVSNTAGSWEVVFTQAGSQAQPFYGAPAATTFIAGQIETVLLVEDQSGNYSEVALTDVN